MLASVSLLTWGKTIGQPHSPSLPGQRGYGSEHV